MDNELELLDSKNQIEDLNLEEIEDLDTLKEKYKSLEGKNRQLFERTKKSEGDLKELKAQADNSDKKPKAGKSDEELLKRFDKLALKTAGITEADEVELFEKWKTDTGRDSDAITENSIFRKELEDVRTARKNQAATSNIKGETGISEAKANPDYWISRSTKDDEGNPVFPEDMPREMFTKVLDKLNPKTQGTKLRFYNSK